MRSDLTPLEIEARQNFVAAILGELVEDPGLLLELPDEKRREFLEALLITAPPGIRAEVISASHDFLELKLTCRIHPAQYSGVVTQPLFEDV